MAFTRADIAAYEQQPQENTTVNTVTAPAATEPEHTTSQESPAAEAESSAADAPDQAELGDVTSDETEGTSTSNATDESGADEGETEGEEAEAEASAEGEESTDHQPIKPLSRASKRIQELNSKMLEASDLAEGYKEFGKLTQEQLKAAREELAELRAKVNGDKPAAKPVAAEPSSNVAAKLGPMPKLTDPDVNFDPDILAQKTEEWTDKKVKLTVQEALSQTSVKAQAEAAVKTFTSRVEEFAKTVPDWEVKVKNPELAPLQAAAKAIIAKNETGPAILYHLASNVAEAKRIAALSAEDQVFEIGAIRNRLESEAKAKPKTSEIKAPVTVAKTVAKKSVSQAPPPPTPVPAGKSSQARDLTDPGLDMNDFARRHRESKNNARLAARKSRGLN